MIGGTGSQKHRCGTGEKPAPVMKKNGMNTVFKLHTIDSRSPVLVFTERDDRSVDRYAGDSYQNALPALFVREIRFFGYAHRDRRYSCPLRDMERLQHCRRNTLRVPDSLNVIDRT